MVHKAGFVNIIGKPNVGKSTLMNVLVGQKISMITSKAQTTRHRIMGIVNGEDFQIIYSDTPGMIEPRYKLQESMMSAVEEALKDADIFLLLTEVADRNYDDEFVDAIVNRKTSTLILINKIDLSDQRSVEEAIAFWHDKKIPGAKIIPVSALHKAGIDAVFENIIKLLPESPPYYDKDELTNRSMRFFVSEIIREQILVQFRKEIPYSVEVVVESYKEDVEPLQIDAVIYVERESQKAILLGHQGSAIKRLGTNARRELEDFIGQHIYLNITIKVNKDWRDNPLQLKRFGYL